MVSSVSFAMPATPLSTPSGSAYGEFLAELDEIKRLKWVTSEQAGHDIGFESALNHWAQQYRSEWRRARNQSPRRPERLKT